MKSVNMWLFFALIATNTLWAARASDESNEASVSSGQLSGIDDDNNIRICRTQREHLRSTLLECDRGRRLIFTLDERRERCEWQFIPMAIVPPECYVWETNNDG